MRRGKRLFERLCLYNGGSSRHMSDSKSIFFNDILHHVSVESELDLKLYFTVVFWPVWGPCWLVLLGFQKEELSPTTIFEWCLCVSLHEFTPPCVFCVVRIVFNWFYCSELTRDGRILLTALYNEKSILAPIFCECGVYCLHTCSLSQSLHN